MYIHMIDTSGAQEWRSSCEAPCFNVYDLIKEGHLTEEQLSKLEIINIRSGGYFIKTADLVEKGFLTESEIKLIDVKGLLAEGDDNIESSILKEWRSSRRAG